MFPLLGIPFLISLFRLLGVKAPRLSGMHGEDFGRINDPLLWKVSFRDIGQSDLIKFSLRAYALFKIWGFY